MICISFEVRFAPIDHGVIQIAVAHFNVYVQICLVRKTRVVQTTAFEVAVFEVDFAWREQLAEVEDFFLKVAV